MIPAIEYVENILMIVHLLTLSFNEAARNSTQFCVKMLDKKCMDNISELWQILAWIRLVEKGRATEPCRTSVYWSDLPFGLTEDLRCLTSRPSLTKLARFGRVLRFHFLRAEDAVLQLLESLEPTSIGLEIQISSAMLYVRTWCEDCEKGCRGCAAKNMVVKMRRLREALHDFADALNYCAYDFANLSENDFIGASAEDEERVYICGKRKISEDHEVNRECKILRTR